MIYSKFKNNIKFLILRVFFVCLAFGIFLYSAKIINASVLTQNTVTPTSVIVGTTTSYTIIFNTSTAIANNGKISIQFPAGFNVSAASIVSWTGFDGTKDLGVSGQTITITRTGGTSSEAGIKNIILENIVNNSTPANNYQLTITTKDSADTVLDGPTGSIYFQLFASHSETNIDGIYYLRDADQAHYQNLGDTIGAGFDEGVFKRAAPTSTEINTCSAWVQYFFDENGTYTQTNQINNIYYHAWWAADGGSGIAGYDTTGAYDGFLYSESFPITNESVPKANDYYLYAGKQVFASPQSISGNAIYNFTLKLSTDAGATRIKVKSSPGQPSFVIFNLPDDATLQGLDSDSDGLSDYAELFTYKTNPYNADTDGDGFGDKTEVDNSMDPNDPDVAPDYGKWLIRQYASGGAGDYFGSSVASIGDIDGDGKQDVLAGAPSASPGGLRRAGSVYIYSSVTGDLIKQFDGTVRDGVFGSNVSSIGDIDGDGKEDVLVGANNEVYLYSSNTGNLIKQYTGDPGSDFGKSSLSAINDIDGDGKQDILVGAYNANIGGSVYIYSSNTGNLLKQYDGADSNISFGISVAAINDIDGDGKQDVLIGANGANSGNGSAYIYSSNTGNLIRQYDGMDIGGSLGTSVAAINDIDGDGKQDVLIGARDASWPSYNYYFKGAVFLYSSGVSKNLLQRFNGDFTYEHLGQSVVAIDDIDGDGKQDILAGTYTGGPILSTNVAYAATYSSGTGNQIKRYNGVAGEAFGSSAVAINDIDGDGKQDILISARNANSATGAVYMYSSTGKISNQSWAKGAAKTNSFDLDDYFIDPNNSTIPARSQTATYTASTADNPYINVSIGAGNLVSFSQPAGWTGTEAVVFTATDSTSKSSTSLTLPLTVTGASTLSAPTIGTPVANSPTSITWSWVDNSDIENSYRVDYVTGAGTDANNLYPQTGTSTSGDTLTYEDIALSPNTQYSVHVHAYQTDAGESEASDNSASVYTLANTPGAPVANNATATTLDVNPVSGGAESSMAIYIEQGETCDGAGGLGYVQTNGTIGATAVWKTDAEWGTTTVTGLSASTEYSLCAKAKNGDGAQTAFGSFANLTSLNATATVSSGGGCYWCIQTIKKPVELINQTTGEKVQELLNKIKELTLQVNKLKQVNTIESVTGKSITQTLQLGSRGEQVKLLQDKLKQLGLFPQTTASNGNFGPATLKAVQDFQTQNKITKPKIYGYGIVGPLTRAKLNGN